MNCKVHLIDDVDTIILLGDKEPGHVVQGTLDQLKAETNIADLILSDHGHKESAENLMKLGSPEIQSRKKVMTKSSQEKDQATNVRVSGSFDAYRYYMRAIGSSYVFILLGLTVSTEFMSVFPGMCTVNICLCIVYLWYDHN